MYHLIHITDQYLRKHYSKLFGSELKTGDFIVRTKEKLSGNFNLIHEDEYLGKFYKTNHTSLDFAKVNVNTLKNYDLNCSSKPVMGILNITPDSFSDGGKYNYLENALDHVTELINEGAEIIDIGGESTRPGAKKVSEKEELSRVLPVIEKIRENNENILISVDTYKSKVAEEAIKYGADIINDISGGTFDRNMFNVAAKYNVPFILMHIKGTPGNMQNNPEYFDVISEIFDYFTERIKDAKSKGVSKIILDPGIGFGKTLQNNFEIIKRFYEFKQLGFPLLMGLSRKSFLGKSLKLEVNERENATVVSEFYSLVNGADIIRTHNVKSTVEAVKLFDFFTNPDLLTNV